MNRKFVALASLWVTTTLTLSVSATLIAIGESSSRFEATGPAGMKISGSASKVALLEEAGRLRLSVSLAELKTGMSLRDKHAKKYLKAEQHPAVLFVVDRSKLRVPGDNQAASGDTVGEFTLAGVTKPLSVHYTVNRTGSDLHVLGNAVVDIRAHGIETPCYLGVCVDPHVKLTVTFKLRDQS